MYDAIILTINISCPRDASEMIKSFKNEYKENKVNIENMNNWGNSVKYEQHWLFDLIFGKPNWAQTQIDVVVPVRKLILPYNYYIVLNFFKYSGNFTTLSQ